MREAALQKRKKVAEELLQWHQRLVEEEREITALELAASAIINQVPVTKTHNESLNAKQKFKGSQLNQLWLSLTGRPEKKFKDEEIYNMSQASLEKFCKNAKKYDRTFTTPKKIRDGDVSKDIKPKPVIDVPKTNTEVVEYVSDFESVITSTSSVSDHCQTNCNSTLSNEEVDTITEIAKPSNERSQNTENTVNEDLHRSTFTNYLELQSGNNKKTETIHSDTEYEESKQDSSGSNIINQILSEIDAYLESQTHNSENLKSANKSISCDSDDDKDSTQTSIQNQANVNDPSSIQTNSAIKTSNKSAETGTFIIDESNVPSVLKSTPNVEDSSLNDIETNLENVTKNTSDEICEQSLENGTASSDTVDSDKAPPVSSHKTSVYRSKSNGEIDHSGLRKADLSHTSASISELSKDEKLNGYSPNSLESSVSIFKIKSNCITSSKENLNQSRDSRDFTIDQQSEKSSNTKVTSNRYEGVSCIDKLYKSTYTDLSDIKDETNFVGLIQQLNKSAEEVTTASNISETSRGINEDVNNKSLNSSEDDLTVTSLNNLNKTNSASVSENLKQSSQASNLFSELHFKVNIEISDEIKSNNALIANGEVPGNLNTTYSCIAEIEPDEISLDIETEEIGNKIADEKISEELDVESFSETIDSVTEIEEDEVSHKISLQNEGNSFNHDISISTQGHQMEEGTNAGSKESTINDKSDLVEQVEGSISEEIKDEYSTDNDRCSFEESAKDRTDPHLLKNVNVLKEDSVTEEEKSSDSLVSNELDTEKDSKEKTTNIKKRVSEILADANISSPRGDKSPRLQDFYVTAYDVTSPSNSPEITSPTDDTQQSFTPPNVFGSDEVEELLKKQLEIEQEIKAIQQQQKEQLPYLFVREIPNKPPPPYTPPVNVQSSIKGSILPSGENEIQIITNASAQILHKAISNNIKGITLTDNAKKVLELKHNVEGPCYEFVFDLCKEFALDHYKQFEPEAGPSWMHLQKRSKLAIGKPLDQSGLQKCINKKVREVLGYETVTNNENFKHKWSGKKRDHVDELLVVESQAEEAEWTNYDRDELIVKDELTKDIMNMLLSETGQVLNNILSKKKYLC